MAGRPQHGLLRLGGPLQKFTPQRDGDGLVQPVTPGLRPDMGEYLRDPFRIPNGVRAGLETGDEGDLTLARGEKPHQGRVDTVDPGPASLELRHHDVSQAPADRAPAAPCR